MISFDNISAVQMPNIHLFEYKIPYNISDYIYKTEDEYYKAYERTHFVKRDEKIENACAIDYDVLMNECIKYYSDFELIN